MDQAGARPPKAACRRSPLTALARVVDEQFVATKAHDPAIAGHFGVAR